MKAIITIYDEYERTDPLAVSFQLNHELLKDALKPLERPNLSANSFCRDICTCEQQILSTENARKNIAKMVADRVGKTLLGYFEKEDTTMGHKKYTN